MYHQIFVCNIIILMIILLTASPASSEMEYFPGLRRPPNWAQSQAADDILAQIIEEQARRRFQQQLAQQHYYQFHHQRGPNAQNHLGNTQSVPIQQAPAIPSFTYSFPQNNNLGQSNNNNNHDNNNEYDDDIPFAVNPSDPRYYNEATATNSNSNNNNNNNKLNSLLSESNIYQHQQKDINSKINGNIVPYSRLKPPMEINPKMPSTIHNNNDNNLIGIRHDINALVNKLEREGQVSAIINDGHIQQRNDVIKKHMGIEGEMGMYVVALIAGVSAAITVGLIALGIGWYTLQKRTKAAADVDYPAYGVTGPNKDISPSGDRRLAQSAQMYHYQHQKQQIIAMENRTSGEHTGGISDVESDDDNDEGDYTVYECPGLAPTGEMEVKNPLFLDDTPVTPSVNALDGQTQSQQQQQKQQQQQQTPAGNNIVQPISKQATKKSSNSSSSSSSQTTHKSDENLKKPSGK